MMKTHKLTNNSMIKDQIQMMMISKHKSIVITDDLIPEV